MRAHFVRGCVALILLGLSAPRVTAAPPERRFALLVGCSRYPNFNGMDLWGPANDIPLWDQLLTNPKGFAFPVPNVEKLVGWPDEVDKRPTRANILKHLERLAGQARPDTQIVIVLNGHGTYIPIPETQDPLDPKNPEPDGLDEVFLPADIKPGAGGGFENGILDDDFEKVLNQMRDRGAAVWVVFDCCHSGTMARSTDRSARRGEIDRGVSPTLLGVGSQQVAAAIARADAATKAAEKTGKNPREELAAAIKPRAGKGGTLVAFYAAQPFERAKELPLPEGQPETPENYRGLFSFTILKALNEFQRPVSYRELMRHVADHHRATRRNREPTPYAEGDVSDGVLGLAVWPDQAEIVLRKFPNKLEVDAGELQGLTPGSVLVVHPPAGDKRDPKTVLGHVAVVGASATAAVVKVVPYDKQPAAQALPELARCALLSQHFGDLRVKLFASEQHPLQATLAALDKKVLAMLALVKDEAEAEWILRMVTSEQAAGDFQIPNLVGDHVVLVRGEGTKIISAKTDRPPLTYERYQAAGISAPRKVFAKYPIADKALAQALQRDLPKIFRWQNVWRIAGRVQAQNLQAPTPGQASGLQLTVTRLKHLKDDSGGQPLTSPVLHEGQVLEIRVKNDGLDDLWVTTVYLDANLGITVVRPLSEVVQSGKSLPPFRATLTTLDGTSTGLNGVVVLAVPTRVTRDRPDFNFLAQSPLLKGPGPDTQAKRNHSTPFAKLLTSGIFNDPGGVRSLARNVPSTPAIVMESWILAP